MTPSGSHSDAAPHTPVLYQQVISALQPSSGGRYIDGTVGAGGHAAGILQAAAPDGELLGLDVDPIALAIAESQLSAFGRRVRLRRGSFGEIGAIAEAERWSAVQGILLDLGASSMQLDDPGRGFSFRAAGPLDMRMDPDLHTTANELVNSWSEADLTEILRGYGEEPRARVVARAIVKARPISSTDQLAQVVAAAVSRSRSRSGRSPRKSGRSRRTPGRHPATRTFQALRIAVNDELSALESALPQAVRLLAPTGRLAVIAFHSLEDRIVKRFLRGEGGECKCPPEQPVCTCGRKARLRLLTRRPIRPGSEELAQNPRARSARLRVAERLELA